jgi:hypothetical protein
MEFAEHHIGIYKKTRPFEEQAISILQEISIKIAIHYGYLPNQDESLIEQSNRAITWLNIHRKYYDTVWRIDSEKGEFGFYHVVTEQVNGQTSITSYKI